MKKFLVSVLATSMCLACLTACGGGNKVKTDLDGAIDWVESLYQEKNVEVSRDYEVLNSVLYDGQTYTIVWSVDVADVKLIAGETSTTVDVNEVSAVDVSYVLTATVKDVNGDTKTISFNRVVKAASDKVPGPIQSAPEEETAYKLYVYQATKQQDCYFIGEMSGFYFKTSEDPEKAVDIYVEYKADSETEFYPYFLDSNETKQYIGMKVSADGKHNNIVYETAPVSVFVWNDELKTITTTIVDRDGKETEFFLGNYSTYVTFQGSALSYAETSNIGHLIGMIDRNSVDAAEKVKQEKNVLTAPKAFVGEASYDLAELGLTFADVKITWAVAGEGASVNGNVLTVNAGADTATVKLTATLSCGDASDTAEFDVVIVPNDAAKIMAAGDALGDGGKFANEVTFTGVVTKVNSKYDAEYGNVTVTIDVNGTSVYCYRVAGAGADVLAEGYTVTVKGFIENFKGSAQIGQGGTIVDYVAGEAPKPDSSSSSKDDGDSSVSTPDDNQESAVLDMMGTTNLKNRTAEQATYSANGITYVNDKASSTTDCYDQQGSYAARAYQGSTITISHSTAFSKIVFTLDDYQSGQYLVAFDGMEIAGATITRNNDVVTITLSAAATSFKTANLIKQARIEKIEVFFGDAFVTPDDDTSSSVGGNTSSSTPDDDTSSSVGGGTSSPSDDATLDTPAAIVDALYALADGESLTGPFTVTGVITALDDWNNPTIVIENKTDKSVYCYKLKDDRFVVGATITITAGSMKNFKGTYEFMDCTLDNIVLPGGETPDDDNSSSAGGSTSSPSDDAPAADSLLTIKEALAFAATFASEKYSENKYYVEGTIKSVYNTQYGNMYLKDAEGNEICVYGTYSADGETSYADLETKPDAGDTVKVYGVIGNYNGTLQLKDAWIVAHTEGVKEELDLSKLPVEGQAYYLKASAYDSYAQAINDKGTFFTVGSTTTSSTVTFYFEKVEGTVNHFYIKTSDGQYVCSKAGENKIKLSTTPEAWIIDGNLETIQSAVNTAYYLQYNANAGQERISQYKGTQKSIWFVAVED